MIEYITKDITTVTLGIVAHGVNTRGIMGSGVALSIKGKWYIAFAQYNDLCNHTIPASILLGTSQVIEIEEDVLYVINNFTQVSFGHEHKKYADLNAVKETLTHDFDFAAMKNLPLYIPKIGCLRGGLSWEDEVLPIVNELAEEFPNLNVYVCDI